MGRRRVVLICRAETPQEHVGAWWSGTGGCYEHIAGTGGWRKELLKPISPGGRAARSPAGVQNSGVGVVNAVKLRRSRIGTAKLVDASTWKHVCLLRTASAVRRFTGAEWSPTSPGSQRLPTL